MSGIISEVLVVEVEFPWKRLSDWNEDQIKAMRESFIKSCIKRANSIVLTGIISDVEPEDYEEKNIKIELYLPPKSTKSKKVIRTIRWQHEDTGRVLDMPIGKNPGHRWYKIPSKGNRFK